MHRDRVVAAENTRGTRKQRVGGGWREGERERESELTVPCGPVTISRVCSLRREGWGFAQGPADWVAGEKGRGRDRK